MFCKNCGTEQEENTKFCHNCGKVTNKAVFVSEKSQFYSEGWKGKKFFSLSSLPYCDLIIDDGFLYLVNIPRYQGGTIGFIIGFCFLNFIGGIIGLLIGNSSDTKKQNLYRSNWLDSEKKIISKDYIKDIFIKISMSEVKSLIFLQKNKLILSYNNEKKVFVKDEIEAERLNTFLNNYVL